MKLQERTVRDLLAAGDRQAAATEAIRWLAPAALRLLRAAIPDEEDASDAFSLWAETLWRSLPSFRDDGPIQHWSLRIARTAARRVRDGAWRRRGRRLRSLEAEKLAAELPRTSALERELRGNELEALRAELTPDQRMLLVLRVDQQLAWADVAAVLSEGGDPIQPATLMKRFERLKARIARRAKERGLLD